MPNIFATPEKGLNRTRLFQVGIEALEKAGWKVERISGSGKSSVRRITKGAVSRSVSIRTTQDTAIAFPRNRDDTDWGTLADVDVDLAVSVDDRENPRFAQAHFIEGDEMRARFNRAYAARKAADHVIPVGRGVWLSLYEKESTNPVSLVGAGAGLDHPPIYKAPLAQGEITESTRPVTSHADDNREIGEHLTIAEAKRRLALSFGVDPSSIKITVEG
jgi:hypothetical protein